MKLQLTKTKTITIGEGRRALSDVTGVVLNTGDARGCPAVRLVHRKNGWSVAAAGFVPSPVDALPESWEEANKAQTPWSLPAAFQAPNAALAVLSPNMFTRQTTPDVLTADLVQTAPKVSATPPPRKLGVRRLEKKPAQTPKAQRAALAFQKLVAAGQRLMSVIRKNEGTPNKDLDRFAREVQSLCDRWDREL